jgi:hypothetical protein
MNRGRVREERGGKEMDGCPVTAMTYTHSHKAVTTYTALLESDESPTSTLPPNSVHLQVRKLLFQSHHPSAEIQLGQT